MHAVNEVSFTFRKGRTLGIVGESGSGKSSLGRVLLKLMDAMAADLVRWTGYSAALNYEFRPLRPTFR